MTRFNTSVTLKPYSARKAWDVQYITEQSSQCGKIAYVKKVAGSNVCWRCGNYHLDINEPPVS